MITITDKQIKEIHKSFKTESRQMLLYLNDGNYEEAALIADYLAKCFRAMKAGRIK